MSGALWQGQCYASPAAAATAAWSGVAPVISADAAPFVSTVEFTTDWQIITRQDGVVLSAVDAPELAFAPCDPVDAALDGMTLGWLVAAVWAGAWAINVLRRAIR